MENITKIPEPTIKRLSDYLHLLIHFKQNSKIYVSSTGIANEMGIDAIQVRKDIEFTNAKGKPKIGYNVDELIENIENSLNWSKRNIAFIVGAGNLGKAVLDLQVSNNYGLQIIDAFDDNPENIGKTINGLEVHPISLLVQLASQVNNKIGILTMQRNVQKAVDLMTLAGIKAIWNFTNQKIDTEPGILVENLNINHSLALFTTKLQTIEEFTH